MRSASLHLARDWQRPPLGRRALALALVLVVHLLLILALLMLSPPRGTGPLVATAMTLVAVPAPKAAPASAPHIERRASGAPKRPVPVVKVAPPVPPKLFTTELFEAIDITKLPNHRDEVAAAGAGTGDAGAGTDSSAVTGPGGGPDGQPLYKAEWVREPTHAELAYYMPKTIPPDSWAIIACKTIERYGVEDCRELGESPPGSGLSRALRQAAWQFRVRPPRIGGKTLVGAWVSIRIDWTKSGGDSDSAL